MRAVDTNVLVRRIMNDEPSQSERARKLMDEGPVWVSLIVLKELSFVLKRKYNFKHVDLLKTIEGLIETDSVVLEDVAVVGAAVERCRSKPGIGFFDCLVLEVARARGHVPLVTFDRKLAREEGAAAL